MKIFRPILSLLVTSTLLLNSCQDFDEFQEDPNRPTNVPASLVMSGALEKMHEGAWNSVMRWNQFYASNFNYYSNQEYSWTSSDLNYTTLKDITKMEDEAIKAKMPALNPYSAMGKFLKAYYFVNMTQRLGDIPMQEALKGLGNASPKYDSQKDVYIQALKWLDEANNDMSQLFANNNTALSGDIYLKNDLKKWQKVVNSYKLRVLISLSKKENDGDLKIKQRFAEIINNPSQYPILGGMDDNLQYVYNSSANKYPRNPDNYGFNATRENLTITYLHTLTSLKDPRTFVVAEPSGAKLKEGLLPTDFNAYVGASSGEDLADMSAKSTVDNGANFVQGIYSFQNRKRYYSGYTPEATIIIGYLEQCFNIAEGINRGWASGNAETHYKNGIESSMAFYGIKEGTNTNYYLKKDGNILKDADYNVYSTNYSSADYYSQPTVKYAGNTADGLKQILTQKYLAFFQNSGWEAFYNQRRTGIPTFLVGPGTANSQRIPKRWQYPSNERVRNTNNWKAALINQFGTEADDINNELWILK